MNPSFPPMALRQLFAIMIGRTRHPNFIIVSFFLAAGFAMASVATYQNVSFDVRWSNCFDSLTIGAMAFGFWRLLRVRFFKSPPSGLH